jgi:hypothetical protein
VERSVVTIRRLQNRIVLSKCATACSPCDTAGQVWTDEGEQAVAHAASAPRGRRTKRQAGPRPHRARGAIDQLQQHKTRSTKSRNPHFCACKLDAITAILNLLPSEPRERRVGVKRIMQSRHRRQALQHLSPTRQRGMASVAFSSLARRAQILQDHARSFRSTRCLGTMSSAQQDHMFCRGEHHAR